MSQSSIRALLSTGVHKIVGSRETRPWRAQLTEEDDRVAQETHSSPGGPTTRLLMTYDARRAVVTKKIAVAVKAFRRERSPRSSFHRAAASSLTTPWVRAAVKAGSSTTPNADAWPPAPRDRSRSPPSFADRR